MTDTLTPEAPPSAPAPPAQPIFPKADDSIPDDGAGHPAVLLAAGGPAVALIAGCWLLHAFGPWLLIGALLATSLAAATGVTVWARRRSARSAAARTRSARKSFAAAIRAAALGGGKGGVKPGRGGSQSSPAMARTAARQQRAAAQRSAATAKAPVMAPSAGGEKKTLPSTRRPAAASASKTPPSAATSKRSPSASTPKRLSAALRKAAAPGGVKASSAPRGGKAPKAKVSATVAARRAAAKKAAKKAGAAAKRTPSGKAAAKLRRIKRRAVVRRRVRAGTKRTRIMTRKARRAAAGLGGPLTAHAWLGVGKSLNHVHRNLLRLANSTYGPGWMHRAARALAYGTRGAMVLGHRITNTRHIQAWLLRHYAAAPRSKPPISLIKAARLRPAPAIKPGAPITVTAPGRPRATLGGAMAGSHIEEITDAFQRYVGAYEPETVLDLTSHLDSLAPMFEAFAQSLGQLAERLGDEYQVKGPFVDMLQQLGAANAGMTDMCNEVLASWRTEHEEDLARHESPRGHESDFWNV